MHPTIVFDFDGTLALGRGPLSAFAREVAVRANDETLVTRCEAALEAFEAGASDARDGYDAVTRVALDAGVERDVLEAAYMSSRGKLGTPDAPIMPPTGLADFLAQIGGGAHLALATNAPGDGVEAILAEWGVADSFDALHFSVGKPAGLIPVLKDALTRGPVLSVGDIVELDLTPAADLGADTALVGATAATSPASVTMRGETLVDLYDDIVAWVSASTLS